MNVFRQSYGNVNRWFSTVVNQPQVKKVVGAVTLCEKMAQFDAKKYAEFQASVGAAPAKKAEKKAEKKPEEKKAPAPKKEKPKKEEDDEEGFNVSSYFYSMCNWDLNIKLVWNSNGPNLSYN